MINGEVQVYPSRPSRIYLPSGGRDFIIKEVHSSAHRCMVPLPYRKPRTAHARSLQIYREARQTRSDKIRSEDISFDLCHGNAAQGIRRTDRATLDGPQVPRDHDALTSMGTRWDGSLQTRNGRGYDR
jgi:hypothetical protein